MKIIYKYNGIAALNAAWLWTEGEVMTYASYKKNVQRGKIEVLQRGCAGTPAVVRYDTLPNNIREAIDSKLLVMGVSNTVDNTNINEPMVSLLESQIKPDKEALAFYGEYVYNGSTHLPADTQNEYYINAIVLNAFVEAFTMRKSKRNACGITGDKRVGLFHSVFAEFLALDADKYPHSLPKSERNFRATLAKYKGKNYGALIHANYGNKNAQKVTDQIERLVLSLYCQSNNPYSDWVAAQYLDFLAGHIDVVDTKTGQLFDRKEFVNAEGEPVTISEGTVWNIISKPSNKVLIDSIRMSYHKFGAMSRPYYHRHNAMYSLSKVSLDDRDLPRKAHDGSRVKAYYAYDVCSGALIGVAYSRKKDADLFINCLRDMFRNLDQMGVGMPMEMEVENHLVRQFEDDLMRAGVVFPFVRWCAPTNSQEKHAEQFNRQKKYGYEKRYQEGIGRWYAALPANQTEGERVYDDTLDKYVIKEKTYSYEQLVADDMESIKAYNNGLHRDQKKYGGKSRMEVLMQNLNPELADLNRPMVVRYIGNLTTTKVVRNQYVTVQNAKYQLSSPEVLNKFKPGNCQVDAYWLSGADGTISEVYLYQEGRYLDTCRKIETFTTAKAEWSDIDTAAMTTQSKYISHFDKMVKDAKVEMPAVKVYERTDVDKVEPDVVEPVVIDEVSVEDKMDLQALMDKWDVSGYSEYAIESI